MLECLILFLCILALGVELGELDARQQERPDPFRLDRWKAGESAELRDE